jgi:adenosylhomocysteine nucleosidase
MEHGSARVLLIRSGIGLVASSSALTRALDAWTCRAVISAGSCGGIGASVQAGDVIAGSAYVFANADSRAFGYVMGQVPGQPELFRAEASLLELATSGGALGGLMLSSDVFATAETAARFREDFPEGMAVEMESAAMAQVCHDAGIPFISIRGVSDLCGAAADEDFTTHVDDAAERSMRVVLSCVNKMETTDKND